MYVFVIVSLCISSEEVTIAEMNWLNESGIVRHLALADGSHRPNVQKRTPAVCETEKPSVWPESERDADR
ncbi:hypothetical protein GWI33_016333 [Rhynchophorus ferrugineus]|uniref:Uncharacterized protein n=1 Tax=Rhynchophorus ferrugineus TaxID=354439 RepID=A0A834M784_RHYFE|nr:hypothetical protein GWI33_016333 [Rhynchophorus ferrugineus]